MLALAELYGKLIRAPTPNSQPWMIWENPHGNFQPVKARLGYIHLAQHRFSQSLKSTTQYDDLKQKEEEGGGQLSWISKCICSFIVIPCYDFYQFAVARYPFFISLVIYKMTQKPENETTVRLDDARESFIGRAQEDDVNRLYLQALVAQRCQNVASNLMLTESTERKRLFLVMHKKMMNSESAKRFEWNQADELRLIFMLDAVVNRECPDQSVEAFKQRVCSGTKARMATSSAIVTWVAKATATLVALASLAESVATSRASISESIVGNAGKGGLGVIVAAMQSRHHCSKWNDKDATVLLAMLECLANMQTKRGLRKVIKLRGLSMQSLYV